jgi:hypothetical protein
MLVFNPQIYLLNFDNQSPTDYLYKDSAALLLCCPAAPPLTVAAQRSQCSLSLQLVSKVRRCLLGLPLALAKNSILLH